MIKSKSRIIKLVGGSNSFFCILFGFFGNLAFLIFIDIKMQRSSNTVQTSNLNINIPVCIWDTVHKAMIYFIFPTFLLGNFFTNGNGNFNRVYSCYDL